MNESEKLERDKFNHCIKRDDEMIRQRCIEIASSNQFVTFATTADDVVRFANKLYMFISKKEI